MDILYNTYERLLSGGVYMLPIFLISIFMFNLIIYKGLTLWIVFRELKKVISSDLKDIPAKSKWNMRANLYKITRSGKEKIDLELREKLSREVLEKVSSGTGILLCSSLATLLGLLGTVSGMIHSFDAIQSFGIANTKSMAAGISEALITTQSGLLVGVVGVLFGKLLTRSSEHLHFKILNFFEILERKLGNR